MPPCCVSPETRGKRRRPVSDDSGSRGGSGGHGGADDVPGLPPALALSMLSHLLAGGNGNVATTAARDFLMADEEAATNLEVLFLLEICCCSCRWLIGSRVLVCKSNFVTVVFCSPSKILHFKFSAIFSLGSTILYYGVYIVCNITLSRLPVFLSTTP